MVNSTKKNALFITDFSTGLKCLCIIAFVLVSCSCSMLKPSAEKTAKRKTAKIERKEARDREKQHKRLTEAHIERQSERTQASMERNREQAKAWRKAHKTKAPLSYRVRNFFDRLFTRVQKPQKGLFKKGVQKRKKKNIFKRIFKRNKRDG